MATQVSRRSSHVIYSRFTLLQPFADDSARLCPSSSNPRWPPTPKSPPSRRTQLWLHVPEPTALSSIALSGAAAIKSRAAHAAFFLTGRAQFWGSAFHLEYFIDTVKEAADAAEKDVAAGCEPQSNGTLLVDVGAAPYNVVGGDISHVLTFLKHWNAGSGATILGFEPGNAPFSALWTT